MALLPLFVQEAVQCVAGYNGSKVYRGILSWPRAAGDEGRGVEVKRRQADADVDGQPSGYRAYRFGEEYVKRPRAWTSGLSLSATTGKKGSRFQGLSSHKI